MKSNTEKQIEEVLSRLNVMHLEDDDYMLNHPQAVRKLKNIFSKALAAERKSVIEEMEKVIGEDTVYGLISEYGKMIITARNQLKAELRLRLSELIEK